MRGAVPLRTAGVPGDTSMAVFTHARAVPAIRAGSCRDKE